jgi:hypothetical protein
VSIEGVDPSPADGEAVPRDAVGPRVQQRQAHRRPAAWRALRAPVLGTYIVVVAAIVMERS